MSAVHREIEDCCQNTYLAAARAAKHLETARLQEDFSYSPLAVMAELSRSSCFYGTGAGVVFMGPGACRSVRKSQQDECPLQMGVILQEINCQAVLGQTGENSVSLKASIRADLC